ncbi:MAG: hypothetical protein EOR80_28765, partial [Mesorhizobium sp.]
MSIIRVSGKSQTLELSRNTPPLRHPRASKERSDAAQTLGSMPLPRSAAAVQNLVMAERGAPLCPAGHLPHKG